MEENAGIIHWDNNQKDIDVQCAETYEKEFTIYPKRVILAILFSFTVTLAFLILAYSKIRVDDFGNRYIEMSWLGSSLWFVISICAGYILAKEYKGKLYPFIIMLAIAIIVSIIGSLLVPIIFDASYGSDIAFGGTPYSPPTIISIYYFYIPLNAFVTMLFSLVGLLIGYSRTQQE